MRLDSWAPPLVVGLLLAALGPWASWAILQEQRLAERSPQHREIAAALHDALDPARHAEGSAAPVVLTDLDLDCSQLAPIDGHVYARSFVLRRQPPVIVEVLPGEACREVPARAHLLERAPDDLRQRMKLPPRVDALLARGLRPATWALPWLAGLAGLGVLLVVVALRTRRRLATELAQALALAAAPAKRAPDEAGGQQGGPYRADERAATLLPRPLALRPSAIARARRTGVVLGGLGGVVLLITLGSMVRAGWAQRAEQRQWSEGVSAVDVGYSADLRSRFFGTFQWLDVVYVYRTEQGDPHVAERTIFAVLGELEQDSLAVHYDPADPTRHALSWSTDQSGAIWRWIVIMGGLGLLLSVSSLAVAYRSMATPRRWRAVLEHPEEVVLEVRSVGAMKYELTVPGQAQPIERLIPSPQEEPLFLDRDRTRVLGLRNPKQPGAIMVVRCDLAPLDLDPGLAAEIRARVREEKKTRRGG